MPAYLYCLAGLAIRFLARQQNAQWHLLSSTPSRSLAQSLDRKHGLLWLSRWQGPNVQVMQLRLANLMGSDIPQVLCDLRRRWHSHCHLLLRFKVPSCSSQPQIGTSRT